MPELPEVETIKRGLSKRIDGKKITDIEVLWHKSFQGDKLNVISYEIISIERRAKVIRIKLSNDYNLLFHLKLTGQLIFKPSLNLLLSKEETLRGGNTRIIFTFDDDSKLFFNDLRKFGWCRVLSNNEIEKEFSKYGIEPLDLRSGQASPDFTVPNIIVRTAKIGNRKIKQFLMDQEIIAGIGNIYADESLFDAGIMPTRKIKDIKLSEWTKIRESILKILKLAIKHGGTTDSDYVNAEGKKGGMQDYLKVYHQTGKPCPHSCGGKVVRIIIGGRGTHYCPNCQK